MTENLDLETVALRRKHVAAAIREHGPEHFHMGAWFQGDTESWFEPRADFSFECGTTACIAGHAVLVARDKFDLRFNVFGVPKFLGLSDERLLFRIDWPEWMHDRASHEVGGYGVAVEALEWLADHPQAGALPGTRPDDWPAT